MMFDMAETRPNCSSTDGLHTSRADLDERKPG
jgi:hypothetical protein